MRIIKSLLALLALLALTAFALTARASDTDFNGRWDIQVHSKPGDIHTTSTKAWWLGITGAGTPDMKIQFVGAPDGSLDDITIAKIQNGVLHFTWVDTARFGHTPNPNDRAEYEVKYAHGLLHGTMMSPKKTL